MYMSFFLLSQICAWVTLILDILTFRFKNRKVILIFLIASTTFLSLHYFFLDKILASTILVASILRFVVSYFTTDKGWMAVFLVLAWVIAVHTYSETYDIIPLIVSILFTLWAFQKNEKILRIFFLGAWILLLIYDIIVFSPVWMLLESIFVISCILWILKFDLGKEVNFSTLFHFYTSKHWLKKPRNWKV